MAWSRDTAESREVEDGAEPSEHGGTRCCVARAASRTAQPTGEVRGCGTSSGSGRAGRQAGQGKARQGTARHGEVAIFTVDQAVVFPVTGD